MMVLVAKYLIFVMEFCGASMITCTLSGCTTKGYFACIHYDKHPLSYNLRSKIGYFGHYRFLPNGHRLRIDNEFAGIHESNDPPGEFSIE
jgi:hypothetical protein